MSQVRELGVSERRPQPLPNGRHSRLSTREHRDGNLSGDGNGQANVTWADRSEDSHLLAALRAGDERAFSTLVDRFHASMVRLARTYVPSAADAEEVAQEAWLGVLKGLDRFEGRSSLQTWIFRILTYQAMNRGKRARRTVPFSVLANAADEPVEPSVQPERFLGPHGPLAGHWAQPPQSWGEPEEQLASSETMALIGQTIDTLPPAQRRVITLRDIEGWSSTQVCQLLGLSESNQRVLLHRARSKVRSALERYMSGDER
jgi:RNA polymerase sigma-70 factor (ECF subfamily)